MLLYKARSGTYGLRVTWLSSNSCIHSNAFCPMPGQVPSLGPATFSTPIGCCCSHKRTTDKAPSSAGSASRQGLSYNFAARRVQAVPGSSVMPEGRKMSVPWLSRTFHSVRKERGMLGARSLRTRGVGVRPHALGMGPASLRPSGGHQPPKASPRRRAARSAA